MLELDRDCDVPRADRGERSVVEELRDRACAERRMTACRRPQRLADCLPGDVVRTLTPDTPVREEWTLYIVDHHMDLVAVQRAGRDTLHPYGPAFTMSGERGCLVLKRRSGR